MTCPSDPTAYSPVSGPMGGLIGPEAERAQAEIADRNPDEIRADALAQLAATVELLSQLAALATERAHAAREALEALRHRSDSLWSVCPYTMSTTTWSVAVNHAAAVFVACAPLRAVADGEPIPREAQTATPDPNPEGEHDASSDVAAVQ